MRVLDIEKPEEAGKVDRREFLGLGVTAGVAAFAGAGVWTWRRGVLDEEQGRAFDPWTTWKEGDKPLRLVGAAVLAASKHNTQPWEFRVQPDYIDVFVHPQRNVGALDPDRQESHIGVGCALANLMLAASAEGYAPSIRYLPDPELDAWIAKVSLAPGTPSSSALYEAIPRRHTNRGAYDRSRPILQPTRDALTRIAESEGFGLVWLTRDSERTRFADLTVEATVAILDDADQANDGAQWYRPTWGEVQQSADGMTLDASGMSRPRRLIRKLFVAPSRRALDEHWLDRTREVDVATAPAFAILTAPAASGRLEWIKGGFAWQRIHLWATAAGMAMQPLTQTIERKNRERSSGIAPRFDQALRELTAGSEAIFAFRAGFPLSPPVASPRRPVADALAKSLFHPKREDDVALLLADRSEGG